jgi:hypothetical protein
MLNFTYEDDNKILKMVWEKYIILRTFYATFRQIEIFAKTFLEKFSREGHEILRKL